MAHCKPEHIEDLEDVLESIRGLEMIKEKGHGKFYLKSKGFLHFHLKDDRRWADIRDGEKWGSEVDLPFKAAVSQKKKFMTEVRKRYKRTLS